MNFQQEHPFLFLDIVVVVVFIFVFAWSPVAVLSASQT